MAKIVSGVVLDGLSGRAGNAVFVKTASGTVLRDRPFVNDPQTPAQLEQRARLTQCARAWKAMTLAQAQAWRDYAAARGGRPQLLFQALGCKVLQVNPLAALPLLPPETEFPGDAVRFAVSGGAGRVAPHVEGSDSPMLVGSPAVPPNGLTGEKAGECGVPRVPELGLSNHAASAQPGEVDDALESLQGTYSNMPCARRGGAGVARESLGMLLCVVVTADRANAPGVVTEVLLQRLPSVHCRTYLSRYRSAGFHAFSAGEARAYSVPKGVYAVATRFIYTSTGQSTALIEWGVVVVN